MSKRLAIVLLLFAVVAGGVFFGLRSLRDSPGERLKRADQLRGDEQFSAARQQYAKVLQHDPSNLRALQGSAFCWLQQGSPLAALPFLTAAADLAPENLSTHLNLAKIWRDLGQPSRARREALISLGLDSTNGEALILLANTSFGAPAITELEQYVTNFEPKNSAPYHLAAAILAGRADDLIRVREHLEQALAAEPESPEVHLAWASYHSLKNDEANAREALWQAAMLSELRSTSRQRYAAYLAKHGETDEAQKLLEEVRAAAPDHLPTIIHLANLHLAKNKYAKALELLEEALTRDPTNPRAVQAKARIYLDQQNRTNAIATLESFDESTQFPATKLELARLYLGANNLSRAQSKLKEALELNPNLVDASLLLAQIELRTGRESEAIGRLEHIAKSRPNLRQAQTLLADAYQRSGRLEAAADLLRSQIALTPNESGLRLGLSRVLRAQNKPAEARSILQEILKLVPYDLAAVAELVSLELSQNNVEGAHASLRQHPKLQEDWRLRLLEGSIYSAESKWGDARKSILGALDLNPGSLHAYSALVQTFLAEQNPAEAITEINRILEGQPSSPRYLMVLALLYEQVNEPQNAKESYEKLLRLEPDFPPALNNLAYLYSTKLQDLERAEELARRAQSLTHTDPAIMDTLGWILHQQEHYAEALPLLEKAAQQLADNAEVQYHLGVTQARMGQIDLAQQSLNAAVASPRNFLGIDSARKELAALESTDDHEVALTAPALEAHLRKHPKDAAAHLQLALLLENTKHYTQALSSFESASRIDPSQLEAWLGQTRLYGGPMKDLDRAIKTGRRARQIDDNNPEIAALLGHIVLMRSEQGDLSWASGLLREASEKRKSPQILYDYAWASYLKGDVELARQTMRTLLDTHPECSEADVADRFLSLTKAADDGWAPVAPLAEATLLENPDDPPALMVKALLQPKLAEEIYLKLLKRYPDFALAKIRLALIYVRNAESLSDADSLAREVLSILDENRELNFLRAAIAYRRKTPRRAIQLLEREQAIAPLPAEGLFYLGMAYHLDQERRGEAKDALRKAIQTGLPPVLENEARTALRQ